MSSRLLSKLIFIALTILVLKGEKRNIPDGYCELKLSVSSKPEERTVILERVNECKIKRIITPDVKIIVGQLKEGTTLAVKCHGQVIPMNPRGLITHIIKSDCLYPEDQGNFLKFGTTDEYLNFFEGPVPKTVVKKLIV